MPRLTGLRTRPATVNDAAAIAEIYNQGIAERVATFETEPRTPAQIVDWFKTGHLVVVAESETAGPGRLRLGFPLQRPVLLCRHRRILGLRGAGLSWARGGARGALRPDRSRRRQRFAQAREPGVFGKCGKPRAPQRAWVRGDRDTSPAWTIGWGLARLRDCRAPARA